MAKICTTHHLVDVMDALHPDSAATPSYAQSSNRLDYALISTNLLDYLHGAGSAHYHAYYLSNH
jgi:hypothetical protein